MIQQHSQIEILQQFLLEDLFLNTQSSASMIPAISCQITYSISQKRNLPALHYLTCKLLAMQTSTLESTLFRLREDLEDVKTRNGQPGCVYLAYKEHTLSAGIYKLESLMASRSENQEGVNALLMQYRQEHQNIFHN